MTIAPARPTATDATGSRALLEGLYLELTAEIEQARAASAIGVLAPGGGDEADVGARAAQCEQLLSLVSSIVARRAQVEAALRRLDEGRYGLCETCGGPIAAERLEVSPSATECVACKQAHERRD
jgi:DnaK suppressor protein